MFDLNGDGYVSPHELTQMMSAMGDNMTQEDLDAMIRLVDKNGDGAIEYNGMLGFTSSTVK